MAKRPSTAELLRSSRDKERNQYLRKSLIDFPTFVSLVFAWQDLRPPLKTTDMDLELLILLLLGEVEEVNEYRQLEGLANYDFIGEKGETIDLGFFIASVERLIIRYGETTDFSRVISGANGQSKGSNAIEGLREVSGNLSQKSLQKDLEFLWMQWTSYLIHMKYPVSPNQVLNEYTFPKNNGNYPQELLNYNPLFINQFQREMNHDEEVAYFAHFRKAMRLIRDFIQIHINPMVEHTGLAPHQYLPYRMYIYSFMYFSEVGLNPGSALMMLEDQLYKDYNIKRAGNPQILRPNNRLSNL